MPIQDEPLDPASWHRGRSRRRSFPGLLVDRLGEVVAALPTQYTPYQVVAHELVGHGAHHRSVLTPVDVSDLARWVATGVTQYFVTSRALSPMILDNLAEHDSRSLAVNGAIGVQVDSMGKPGIDFTMTLTAVTLSGDVVHHPDYEAVFKAAVGAARRVLSRAAD